MATLVIYLVAGAAALALIFAAHRAVKNATPIDDDYDDTIGFQ